MKEARRTKLNEPHRAGAKVGCQDRGIHKQVGVPSDGMAAAAFFVTARQPRVAATVCCLDPWATPLLPWGYDPACSFVLSYTQLSSGWLVASVYQDFNRFMNPQIWSVSFDRSCTRWRSECSEPAKSPIFVSPAGQPGSPSSRSTPRNPNLLSGPDHQGNCEPAFSGPEVINSGIFPGCLNRRGAGFSFLYRPAWRAATNRSRPVLLLAS